MEAGGMNSLFVDAHIEKILVDLGLVVDHKAAANAKVLVGRQEVALLSKDAEAHAIGVRR
jgi:hypothetical protein